MAKMDEKFKNLPLRNGVGIVLLNKENKVFVAKRIDNPKNYESLRVVLMMEKII